MYLLLTIYLCIYICIYYIKHISYTKYIAYAIYLIHMCIQGKIYMQRLAPYLPSSVSFQTHFSYHV